MSQDDVIRFVEDLKSNPELLAEVRDKAGGLASVVELAKSKGYDITIDETKSYVHAEAGRELSDEQLDAVAGGKSHHHSVATQTEVATEAVEAVDVATTQTVEAETTAGAVAEVVIVAT